MCVAASLRFSINNLILSGDNKSLRKINQENDYLNNINDGEVLSFEIEYALCNLLEKEIEFVKTLDTLLRELSLRRDFTPFEIFSMIDEYGMNYFTVDKYGNSFKYLVLKDSF